VCRNASYIGAARMTRMSSYNDVMHNETHINPALY
jgi:hypothetical protein